MACIFCRQIAEAGKQHVFGDLRRQNGARWQAGSVCASCRGGWIGRLEAAIEPWILNVETDADIQRFQAEDRRLIFARWALTTACLLDRTGRLRKIGRDIPAQLFHQQHALPDNIHVLAGFHKGPDSSLFNYNQRNWWTEYPLGVRCEEPDCGPDGKFKLAFAVDRLMVLVAGVPSPHLELVIGTGVHVPIWPATTIRLQQWFYPLRTGMGAEEKLRNFSDLVAVAHAGKLNGT